MKPPPPYPTFLLILNRNARRLRPGSSFARNLANAATRAGGWVRETTTLEELDAAARQARDSGAQTVVLAGGDGTCMRGVTALARAYDGAPLPRLGFAAAGTVGTIARNFGLWGPGAALRLLQAIGRQSARATRTATLRVRDDSDGDRVGFIFGAGLVGAFFDMYDAAPRKGLGAAAGIAARVFASSLVGSALARRVLAQTPAALTVDGESRAGKAFSLVAASVLVDLGLHMRLTYRAREAPPLFHVVASGLAPTALGPQLPRVLAGRPLRGEPRVDELASSVDLRFTAARSRYILDGEGFSARTVSVRAGPSFIVLLP